MVEGRHLEVMVVEAEDGPLVGAENDNLVGAADGYLVGAEDGQVQTCGSKGQC